MFDLTKIVSLSFLFAPSLKMLFHFQSSGQDMGLIVGLQLLIQQLKGGNVNLDGPLTLEQILHDWSQAMRLEVKLQMQRKISKGLLLYSFWSTAVSQLSADLFGVIFKSLFI